MSSGASNIKAGELLPGASMTGEETRVSVKEAFKDNIVIRGASENNLKGIDLEIPRNNLVVITGISGSGKSSLAFDTIYAEGQRRYVESLSAYARQFLGQMEKPDVEYIEGLSPAISIDQKATSKNPRSTVGTVTEIYDYLRLLFARIGIPHCYKCGRKITAQTVDQMVERITELEEGTRIQLLAPVVRDRKGEHKDLLRSIQKDGFVRVRIDGEVREINEEIELEKNIKHTIEIVVDRIIIKEGIEKRLSDSLETVLTNSEGLVIVDLIEGEDLLLSENFACVHCGISLPEIAPRSFSFNSPHGACSHCDGLGIKREYDPGLILDQEKSINDGGLIPWASSRSRYYPKLLKALADHYGFSLDEPIDSLSEEIIDVLLYGSEEKLVFNYRNRFGRVRKHRTTFKGIVSYLREKYNEVSSEKGRRRIEKYMSIRDCPSCKGNRLKPSILAVTVDGHSIADVNQMSIREADNFFAEINLTSRQKLIGKQILKEIRARLGFLLNVGLEYLTLDRKAGTLSGGEAQRIRLATQIGSSLVGVLYILDEPSIGLHQRDNQRLLDTLKDLRDLGNTVLVVEHDEETIRQADYIIDMGPGAGIHGGDVVAKGEINQIIANSSSLTGSYLTGKKEIPVPQKRVESNGKYLQIKGARAHNLQNINVKIPLGLFVCVTGVSGSGKSTLVNETLYRSLAQTLYDSSSVPGDHDKIEGIDNLDKVIIIDQSPIGRTPRSNPATYTKVFDYIRDVFAQTPEAKTRGYSKGRFSFNVKGGRCEACKGQGINEIEMHFLPDVYVPCDVCGGKRYNRETLEVKYKGKTIADILNMTVDQAAEFFSNIPKIEKRLSTLQDVGLGYMRLGQPSTTLSGGEAQRVKLSTELSKRSTGQTLYILDEPTTGLHFEDINKLLQVLKRLRDEGNTVLVIEHNLDVIKTSDYIIDLGPEGGDGGGRVVASGTPEKIADNKNSYTGEHLKKVL